MNQKICMVDNRQYSNTLLLWQPCLPGSLSSLRGCKVPALELTHLIRSLLTITFPACNILKIKEELQKETHYPLSVREEIE